MEEDIYQDPELYPGLTWEKPSGREIYQELKSDFKKGWTGKKTNYLSYIIAVILILGIYFFIHKTTTPERAPEVSKTLDYIQVDWQVTEVSKVKVLKIPQEVFDNMEIDPEIPQEIYDKVKIDRTRDKYLLWDQKIVLLITWNGCPYARKFRREIDNIFSKNASINGYYLKEIRETWQTVNLGWCIGGYNCAAIRLFENCGEWICIINPITREVVADSSQNAKQILPLLKAYRSRYNEPLLD